MNPYHIALTLIPGLGCKSIRQLLGICRKPEELFAMSHAQLKEIFQNHHTIIADIESRRPLMLAEQQIPLMQGYGVDTLFCTEEEYPQRLNEAGCEDTPVLLYRIGRSDLNAKHTVAMVGSRKCTDYGRTTTRRLVQEMKTDNTTIVSGLAYGIDTAAHTAALDNGLPTVAVMGHGLDIVYPYQNRLLARKIVEQGGTLLSEYPVGTGINAAYFPARNRIVAALSDATIVVEAAERGGALITANMANSYHREVFAVPGRLGDPLSEGCNNLVIHNKAVMIRNAGDLFYQMLEEYLRPPATERGATGHLFFAEQQRTGGGATADRQQRNDHGRNRREKWYATPKNSLHHDGFGAEKRREMSSWQIIQSKLIQNINTC